MTTRHHKILEDNIINGENNHNRKTATVEAKDKSRVVVIGGSNIDFTCRILEETTELKEASYPGDINISCGGVGRNITEALTRLSVKTKFLTALGNDYFSQIHRTVCPEINWSNSLILEEENSAVYVANVKHNGSLIFGTADMNIHDQISPQYLKEMEANEVFDDATLLVCDGNIPNATIYEARKIAKERKTPFWYEPTDLFKATRAFRQCELEKVDFVSPNIAEFKEIAQFYYKKSIELETYDKSKRLETLLTLCRGMHAMVDTFLLKLGSEGILVVSSGSSSFHIPALQCRQISSVSGAGDSLVAGFIRGIALGKPLRDCATDGLICAYSSLLSTKAINPDIQNIYETVKKEWRNIPITDLD